MERSSEVESVVEHFYALLRQGDDRGIRELLSPNLSTAIGTDEAEWWSGHETASSGFAAQLETAGGFEVRSASPHGYSEGGFGWFEDRATLTLHENQRVAIRFTGVVCRQQGRWRIVQCHVSVGMPNEELGLDLPV